MTNAELDSIEEVLEVRLPETYRQVSITFPFQPLGQDWVYWFYDDPAAVIGETQAPLSDGGYDFTDWRETFVAFGQSAAGDIYLIDTAGPACAPVYLLSHETHEIQMEWPDMESFVDEYSNVAEEVERQRAESRAAEQAWWRRAWQIMAVIVVCVILLPLLLLLLRPNATV